MSVLRLEEANSTGSELADHFDRLISDLNQIDGLVGDAVGRLVAGFLRISGLVRQQQEITATIVDSVMPRKQEPVTRLLARQAGIAEQIEREVNAIVVSLQFGDLAIQLLGHSALRVEMLRSALQHTLLRGANPCGSSRDKTPAEEAERTWDPASCKPVIQRDMRAGDVELF